MDSGHLEVGFEAPCLSLQRPSAGGRRRGKSRLKGRYCSTGTVPVPVPVPTVPVGTGTVLRTVRVDLLLAAAEPALS
jgi:hypothetical protein